MFPLKTNKTNKKNMAPSSTEPPLVSLDSPQQTGNGNLADIIQWLQEGYDVCIHTNTRARYFKGATTTMTQKMIYVNVARHAGLIDEGEWDWYIKNAGFLQQPDHIVPIKEDDVDKSAQNFYFGIGY